MIRILLFASIHTVINYACIALAFVQVAVVRTIDTEVTDVYLM